jgi:cold shock CspA family protein
MLLQASPRTRTSVGFVKWFGGINKKTGKENEYGFIESIDGDDLFVHASQLGGVVPEEGSFAVFTVDGKDADKKKAVDVSICGNIETFKTEPLIEFLYDIEGFQKFLVTTRYRDVLRSLVNRKDNEWAVDFLAEVLQRSKAALYVVGELLSDSTTQTRLLKPLSFGELEAIDDTFKYVPRSHFDNEYVRSFEWLRSKSPAERDLFFNHKINDLSTSFVLTCVFEGLINDPNMLDRHTEDIKLFVGQALQKQFASSQQAIDRLVLLDYVRETFHRRFTGFDELSSCPALVPFFELPLIKQKVFSKDRSFVDDVERSGRMSRDPETFVLYSESARTRNLMC